MKTTIDGTNITVRPFVDADERQTLDLMAAALGPGPAGGRAPAFFRWKHLRGPFGRSVMLVAESADCIVGLRAFMAWEFVAAGRRFRAFRAVDTATHPDVQGRGIFSRLTREALEVMSRDGDLVFNTPNSASLPGYLKLGWKVVERVPVGVRVLRPARVARGLRTLGAAGEPDGERPRVDAPPAAEVLADAGAVDGLLGTSHSAADRFVTPRTAAYLRWRYSEAPFLDYRAIRAGDREEPSGIAIFRVRPRGSLWESTVAEVIVRDGDRRIARRLLRGVAEAAPVDHVTCRFLGSDAVAVGAPCGFVRAPGGVTLVARALRADVTPDPCDGGSWALSLGDIEVF